MSQSIRERVQLQLYDLFDNTKFELSELNQNKNLVINGPDSKLIKRGLDISYLQGQKKSIDAIHTLLTAYTDDATFIDHFHNYTKLTSLEFETSASQFQSLTEPQDEFEIFLANHYKLMGQKLIIDTINTIIDN
ncbi:MAG TPA: hypothetical protein VK115_04915 [Staphylococcus sp.]|nr:hypothetical protein [Staphylococcus sp.]